MQFCPRWLGIRSFLPSPACIFSINQRNVAFHPILMPNFANVFPIRAAVAQHGEYLAEEAILDI